MNNFNKKFAFTLAEFLITIGIIGIIAVTTLPIIAKTNERRKVEMGLQRFYSTINQAVRLTKTSGDTCFYTRLDGVVENKYDENLKVLQDCILPNLRYARAEKCNSTSEKVCVYLNGAGEEHFTFHIDNEGGDITYCIYGKEKRCKLGETAFRFQFIKGSNSTHDVWYRIKSIDSVDPYYVDCCTMQSGYEHASRSTACRNNPSAYNKYKAATEKANSLCTIALKNNGWKFPKNYKLVP